jgi:tRNA(fMet)-specific endonuclease VapC
MTTRIALDTNAYRALDDGNEKLSNLIKTTMQIGIPITVLGELYYGIFLGGKQEQNLSNLNHFLSLSRIDILHIDETTAKLFGEIATELRRIGRPIQQDDMWIAALCKQHSYTLATADKDFSAITGLELFTF